MARGGARQGTPGRSYSNRTDLNVSRAPAAGTATPAAGGLGQPAAAPAAWKAPEDVPKLDDPTARPDEPVTAGLESGPGAGPEALGRLGPSPAARTLQAAYLAFPTPELARTLALLRRKGGA